MCPCGRAAYHSSPSQEIYGNLRFITVFTTVRHSHAPSQIDSVSAIPSISLTSTLISYRPCLDLSSVYFPRVSPFLTWAPHAPSMSSSLIDHRNNILWQIRITKLHIILWPYVFPLGCKYFRECCLLEHIHYCDICLREHTLYCEYCLLEHILYCEYCLLEPSVLWILSSGTRTLLWVLSSGTLTLLWALSSGKRTLLCVLSSGTHIVLLVLSSGKTHSIPTSMRQTKFHTHIHDYRSISVLNFFFLKCPSRFKSKGTGSTPQYPNDLATNRPIRCLLSNRRNVFNPFLMS